LGSKRKRRRETSGIPREAWDPNSKKKSNEWNPKGSSGSKLKGRREMSGPQGKLGIQTQKKKRNEWNPKGSLGSKLKRREKRVESQGKLGIQTQKKREMSGIPRKAWDPNSKEDKGTSQGESPILHPIFVAVPTEIVIQVR
jgi:hypothetical protein